MSNEQLKSRVSGRGPVTSLADQVGGYLQRMAPELAQALPRAAGLTLERLTRIAITTIKTTPGLQNCDVGSLLAALVQAAQLGLAPDPRLGEAYLVPYRNKGVPQCQLIVGYRGKIALARRSGLVSTIEARVVYEGDVFTCEFGIAPILRHVPNLSGARGKPFAVYALAVMADGSRIVDVLSAADVAHARASSRAQSGPWFDHEDEMWRKTAAHRICKYLPQVPEMADAMDADGKVAVGIDLTGGVILEVPSEPDQIEAPTPESKPGVSMRRKDPPAPKLSTIAAAVGHAMARADPDRVAAALEQCGVGPLDWHVNPDVVIAMAACLGVEVES